jgi:hypothetical protein
MLVRFLLVLTSFVFLFSCKDRNFTGKAKKDAVDKLDLGKSDSGNPDGDNSTPPPVVINPDEANPTPTATPVPNPTDTPPIESDCKEFNIPPEEFDELDGSANAWIKGRNHAYIDWSKCPTQMTKATVDNGGIRINFKNPPSDGRKLTLIVNTTHARIYRVGYASNIKGSGLPGRYTSNKKYTYECVYAAPNYNCVMK